MGSAPRFAIKQQTLINPCPKKGETHINKSTYMISLSKHYFDARLFRIFCILLLLLVVSADNWAQPQSVGHGVYLIFNDFARTHWKSADSIEQVLDHISFYPKWKKEDLKESIIYLQTKKGYVYRNDSVMCYFDGDICAFEVPRFVQPCELMADTSIDAFLRKTKIAPVCFDKEGHVVYSADHFFERRVSKLQNRILKTKSKYPAVNGTWIPLVIKKESESVQNYCTKENLEPDKQTVILRYVQRVWKRHPNVTEVRIGLHFPQL